MKNTLGDLNNHLFAQLERLSDEDIKGEALAEEIERAKAVTSIANITLENLQLITKKQLATLNKKGLIANDADLTRTGIIMVDIYQKISERKRQECD